MATSVVRRLGKRLPSHTAATAVAIGDLVYLTSSGTWDLSDADAAGKREVHGVVTQGAASGGTPEVCEGAVIGGLTGMTIGGAIFLSDTGTTGNTTTQTAPATSTDVLIKVGYADSATQAVIQVSGYYAFVA